MPKLRMALAVGAATLMLAVAGCSDGDNGAKVATINGSDSDTSSSSNGGGGDGTVDRQAFEDALLEHAQCMRDHGVDMPDPTFNGDGGVLQEMGEGGINPESQEFKDAEAACKSILDEVERSMPKPSPEEQAKMQEEMLEFAQCMREHGIDMPDPTFDGDGKVTISVGGPGNAPPGGSDASDSSDGGPSVGKAPRVDPAFEAAMEACQKEGKGPRIGMNGGPDSSDSSDGSDG